MKLLLTGSRGFVGSYFREAYGKKYEIETYSFRTDDFDKLSLEKIEAVVHLSALVHQMGGVSKEEYYRVNLANTLSLAKKAKSSGVKQFIFMSTVKVYGEESEEAYCENTPCFPQDDYGKSKLAAEEALLELEDENFKVAIIRTPIVYGHGVKANIQNLISLVQRVFLLPFGNIDNKRSMIYIGNLCYLVSIIIEKKQSGIFLAVDDKPLSTTKFIELIAKALDRKVYLLNIPLFPWLLKKLKPSFYKRLYKSLEINNTQTKKELNYKNIYTTEEGIRYMIYGENK